MEAHREERSPSVTATDPLTCVFPLEAGVRISAQIYVPLLALSHLYDAVCLQQSVDF